MPDFLSDTFTDPDGTLLTAHAPDVGGAWSGGSGGMQVLGNALTMTAGGGYETYVNAAVPATADYSVEALLKVVSPGVGNGLGVQGRIVVATTGDGYYWSYYPNAGVWRMYINGAGVFYGLLAQVADSFAAGQSKLAKLRMTGSTIEGLVDGVQLAVVTDTHLAGPGRAGVWGEFGTPGDITLDNLRAFGVDPHVHPVSGRGNFSVTSPAWLSTEVPTIPDRLSAGLAEPPNNYHVGMISWGTVAHGAMAAYPVTRQLDLVAVPAGMDTVWYEFAAGVTATITELAAP